MSDVTDAQREIAGIVAEFHRKIRMRTGMVDAISRIVVSDGLSLALGIPRDGAIFGNVELVPDPGVRAAAAEALEDATPAVPGPPEVEWRYGPDCAEASVGPLDLDVYNNGHGSTSPLGSVRPYMYKVDTTGLVETLYTNQEKLTPVYSAPVGRYLRLGSGPLVAIGGVVLYAAGWFNANAEISDANVKALLQALGWTIPW